MKCLRCGSENVEKNALQEWECELGEGFASCECQDCDFIWTEAAY